MLQLKEEELRDLQSAIKEHVERVTYHLPPKKQPIFLHHAPSGCGQSSQVNKHSELPMKQTTGRCINYR